MSMTESISSVAGGMAAGRVGAAAEQRAAARAEGFGGGFAERLGGAIAARSGAGTQDVDGKAKREARMAAAGLVTHALILPILKQVRRGGMNKSGPFSPGNGEKAFGPEFDMQIADRIAQSPTMSITASLERRLLARHAAKAATTSGTGAGRGVDVDG